MKKRKKGILLGSIIAAAAVLATIGGVLLLSADRGVNIKGQRLNQYDYYEGGGMTGGYYRETVKQYDDSRAIITVEKAEWHNTEPEITEYLVDLAVLDELEGVIRKYNMNRWDGKTFTNMFIADGESKGYSFEFDESTISFSSQYYPAEYRGKLAELDAILHRFINSAT